MSSLLRSARRNWKQLPGNSLVSCIAYIMNHVLQQAIASQILQWLMRARTMTECARIIYDSLLLVGVFFYVSGKCEQTDLRQQKYNTHRITLQLVTLLNWVNFIDLLVFFWIEQKSLILVRKRWSRASNLRGERHTLSCGFPFAHHWPSSIGRFYLCSFALNQFARTLVLPCVGYIVAAAWAMLNAVHKKNTSKCRHTVC